MSQISGYCNSFRAMRLNIKEEKQKEQRLKELQIQEDKKLGIWAKKQLRIEQQIAIKQSPLQRARRIRTKRQEELQRICMNIENGIPEHKPIERKLSLRRCSNEKILEPLELEEEDDDISRTSSRSSLPTVPVTKHKSLTNSRSTSLPTLLCNSTTPNKKRTSLPSISAPQSASVHTRSSTQQQVHKLLPPLKRNCWI